MGNRKNRTRRCLSFPFVNFNTRAKSIRKQDLCSVYVEFIHFLSFSTTIAIASLNYKHSFKISYAQKAR